MKNAVLETPRLLLRKPDSSDFEGWKAFSADAETMEHLGGVQHEADALAVTGDNDWSMESWTCRHVFGH